MTQVLEDYIETGIDCFPDDALGAGYRCSVDLIDGTNLPCVMIRRKAPIVDLANRRLAEEKNGTGIFRNAADPYREVLSHFLTSGNRVNAFDVKLVSKSPNAIPMPLLQKIRSEFVMSWTGFVLEMNDGRRFAFGTTFLFAFFNLPSGYDFGDVQKVFNHSYLDKAGELRFIHDDTAAWSASFADCAVHREKPYFDCFV